MKLQENIDIIKNSSRQLFIKGSGTSACLLNGKLDDEPEFIQLKSKNLQITDIQLSGLFVIAIVQQNTNFSKQKNQHDKQCSNNEGNKNILARWGNFNDILIAEPQILNFNNSIGVKKISCGWNHALILTTDGQLFGIGQNKYGQIGVHNKKSFYDQPIQVMLKQPNQDKVQIIAAGFRQSYWTTSQYDIYGCGQSKNYQLGQSNKKQLFPSTKISFQLKQKTTNQQKQSKIVKICCGKKFMVLLNQNNQGYGLGSNDYKCLDPNQTISYLQSLKMLKTQIKDIECGWSHILFLDLQGNIWSRGRNNFGQLGVTQVNQLNLVDIKQKCVQIQAGTQFSFARGLSGKLYGWGWNQHMNIANQPQIQVINKPVEVKVPQNFKIQKCVTYPAITIIK